MAPAAAVAWGVDDDGEVAVEPTGAGGLLVVDEELSSDEFKFARAIEVLACQADLAVEFVKLKHCSNFPAYTNETIKIPTRFRMSHWGMAEL